MPNTSMEVIRFSSKAMPMKIMEMSAFPTQVKIMLWVFLQVCERNPHNEILCQEAYVIDRFLNEIESIKL